jgi:hypothetical protein
VDVWLRNGSELRGRWADPKLAMSIAVGGADVPVDLPMNELSRFQLQGGARWPGGPVYRMRTRTGDDFLVDPTRTRLQMKNDLGAFAPLLSECRYVAPVGDPVGPWRVELQTGTVLIGKLEDAKVTVALPMGPDAVSVPLDQFVSLRVETWGAPAVATEERTRDEAPAVSYDAPGVPYPSAVAAPATAPARKGAVSAASAGDDGGWFDSAPMEATKQAQPE